MSSSFSPLAPSPAWLGGRAAAAGGVLSLVRPSRRSFSGAVGVVWFGSAPAAAAFARSLAPVVGAPVAVRRWSVSVPVWVASC